MKILVTSIVDLKKSPPNRPHHFIRYLSKKHDITVVSINDWWRAKQLDGGIYHQQFEEVFDRIEYHYLTEKKISPIMQEVLCRFLFNPDVLDGDYDVLFNYNTLIFGRWIAKKKKIPMVYDIADDLPEMIANSPQIPRIFRGVGKRYGEHNLKKNVKSAKTITATTPLFQKKYSIPEEKFVWIPNGVDTEIFRRRESDEELKEKLGLEDCFVLGYVGVLREWVDLEPVYKALRKLEGVKLVVVGEEGRIKENKEMVKNMGIEDKVIFVGTVPYVEVPRYISIFDAGLIPFKKNEITENAVPLKLFEYLYMGKPVISTKLRGVVENLNFRNVFFYESIKEFVNKTRMLAEESRKVNEPTIKDFTWKSLTEDVEVEIQLLNIRGS